MAQSNGIEDLLKDILEGVGPVPQTPIYGTDSVIALPVTIALGIEAELPDHTLHITATPPDPSGNARRSSLRPLAHLSLAMGGLKDSLNVPLAIPANWQDSYPYLIIDARIKDSNEGVTHQAEQLTVYRGDISPNLTLSAVGLKDDTPPPARDYTSFELVKGELSLTDKRSLKRGSVLTLQLLENALAGGTSMMIAAEKIVKLDGQSFPLAFELERGLLADNNAENLAFKAWINDWANRKTHVLRGSVTYQGPDIDYTLKLDAIKQGKDTKRGRNMDPTLMAQTLVSGEAVFDPVKGSPGSARLKIQLKRSVGAYGDNPILSEQTLILRGMETRIPFAITTDSTNFDPLIPAPYINVALTDTYGREYYASGDVRASEGQNIVQLFPR